MTGLRFPERVRIATVGGNRSSAYAQAWLTKLGLEPVDAADAGVLIVAGDEVQNDAFEAVEGARVVVWDFQVGRPGSGFQAAAAAGVAWAVGSPGRPPIALPAEMPEKWCGLMGATLALSVFLPGNQSSARQRFDVSAADMLRSFADQNAGNHQEVVYGWRRNGRFAVEHGGIYPQGFFDCADGYVAIVARSRRDWGRILAAVGDPEWASEPGMDDPVALAVDPTSVNPLLEAELKRFTRDELLERALDLGATIAPVYDARELAERDGIVRASFVEEMNLPGLPFEFGV